ncbi:hypothetical protein L1D53_23975 [Vibrio alginolyticus]|uniref:calcium-binding protein n=2 Tax=Vibrio alginolyticus TaxID=663 RepID=UPI001EFE1F50|nr:calcium-binding protein [Vibrio alginolyticus]MCG9766562.1 hypothetical protein [Vibrio alginolyticus]
MKKSGEDQDILDAIAELKADAEFTSRISNLESALNGDSEALLKQTNAEGKSIAEILKEVNLPDINGVVAYSDYISGSGTTLGGFFAGLPSKLASGAIAGEGTNRYRQFLGEVGELEKKLNSLDKLTVKASWNEMVNQGYRPTSRRMQELIAQAKQRNNVYNPGANRLEGIIEQSRQRNKDLGITSAPSTAAEFRNLAIDTDAQLQRTKARGVGQGRATNTLAKVGDGVKGVGGAFSVAQGGVDIAAGKEKRDALLKQLQTGKITQDEYDTQIHRANLRVTGGAFGIANGVVSIGELASSKLSTKLAAKAAKTGVKTGSKAASKLARFLPVVGGVIGATVGTLSVTKNAIAASDAAKKGNAGQAAMFGVMAGLDGVTVVLDVVSTALDFIPGIGTAASFIVDLVSTAIGFVSDLIGFFTEMVDTRDYNKEVDEAFNKYTSSEAFKTYLNQMTEKYKKEGYDVFEYYTDANSERANILGDDSNKPSDGKVEEVTQIKRDKKFELIKELTKEAENSVAALRRRVIIDESGETATREGGEADDLIKVITSDTNGVKTLLGHGGNDTLIGGITTDIINGGTGDDYIDGGPSADRLLGGPGDDILVYDSADLEIDGQAGTDTLLSTGLDKVIWGQSLLVIEEDNNRSSKIKHATYRWGGEKSSIYEKNMTKSIERYVLNPNHLRRVAFFGGDKDNFISLNENIDGGARIGNSTGIASNGKDMARKYQMYFPVLGQFHQFAPSVVNTGDGDDIVMIKRKYNKDQNLGVEIDGGAGNDSLFISSEDNVGQVMNINIKRKEYYISSSQDRLASNLYVSNMEYFNFALNGTHNNSAFNVNASTYEHRKPSFQAQTNYKPSNAIFNLDINNTNGKAFTFVGSNKDDVVKLAKTTFGRTARIDGGGGQNVLDLSQLNQDLSITLGGGQGQLISSNGRVDIANFYGVSTGKQNDTVTGTAGNDLIIINGGRDTVNAGNGNDTLVINEGHHDINGGDGTDTYSFNLNQSKSIRADITDNSIGNHIILDNIDSITDITFESTLSGLAFKTKDGNIFLLDKAWNNVGGELESKISSFTSRFSTFYLSKTKKYISSEYIKEALRSHFAYEGTTENLVFQTSLDQVDRADINLGSGNDMVIVDHLPAVSGQTKKINTGEGNDYILFKENQDDKADTSGIVKIITGDGDDIVSVGDTNHTNKADIDFSGQGIKALIVSQWNHNEVNWQKDGEYRKLYKGTNLLARVKLSDLDVLNFSKEKIMLQGTDIAKYIDNPDSFNMEPYIGGGKAIPVNIFNPYFESYSGYAQEGMTNMPLPAFGDPSMRYLTNVVRTQSGDSNRASHGDNYYAFRPMTSRNRFSQILVEKFDALSDYQLKIDLRANTAIDNFSVSLYIGGDYSYDNKGKKLASVSLDKAAQSRYLKSDSWTTLTMDIDGSIAKDVDKQSLRIEISGSESSPEDNKAVDIDNIKLTKLTGAMATFDNGVAQTRSSDFMVSSHRFTPVAAILN